MTHALNGLAELARQRAERDGLTARLEVARAQHQRAQERVAGARTRLEDERADVTALESLSMTRILAGLRGSREADLDRERAEAAVVEYAVAEAEARAEVEAREIASLEARIREYWNLDIRHAELLEQREREMRDDPGSAATAGRLDEVAERLGALEAEAVQLAEADSAARQAHDALQQAARHLGSAGSWATYDTFFGGGMVGDLMKHQRLDQAAALMRAADAALARLATELADVGIGSVGEVGITELTRALDIWFDNIFSDWAVRDRIGRAANRVQELLVAVGAVGQELQRRQAAVARAQQQLAGERERLLTGDA